ncbi:MAG: DUF5622 domain-containing protein [Desulfurococcales archaeon]|nr:DUF5622 domain-containing protein [Desulfurococcales archaeon]
MGGKHGKYVYIRVSKGSYVKARRFKKRGDDDPEKYVIIGPWVKTPPQTYEIIDVDLLPYEIRVKLGIEEMPEKEEEKEETTETSSQENGEQATEDMEKEE